jgi:hypothetical protein
MKILCRCSDHSPPKSNVYVGFAYPLGGNQTSTICGSTHCDHKALVWMDDDAAKAYGKGERVFAGPNNFTKVEIDGTGVTPINQFKPRL